jgi:ABC-type multidrug transport system fused ATPase/permease subunit
MQQQQGRTAGQRVWNLAYMVYGWQRGKWWFCLSTSVIGIMLSTYVTRVNGLFIDALNSGPNSWTDFGSFFGTLLTITAIKMMLGWLTMYFGSHMSMFNSLHFSNFALQRFLSKDLDFYQHPMTEPQKLSQRVRGDSMTIPFLSQNFIYSIVAVPVNLLVVSWYLTTEMYVPWRILVIGLIAQPILAVVTAYIADLEEQRNLELNALQSDIDSAMVDIMQNLPSIKILLGNDEIIRRRKEQQYKMIDMKTLLLRFNLVFTVFLDTVDRIIYYSCFTLGCLEILERRMTYGDVATCLSLLNTIQSQFTAVYGIWRSWKKARGVAESFALMLDAPVQLETHTDRQTYSFERQPARKERYAWAVNGGMWQALRDYVTVHRQGFLTYKTMRGAAREMLQSWHRQLLPIATGGVQAAQAGVQPAQAGGGHHPEPWSLELVDVTFSWPRYAEDAENPVRYPRVRARIPTPPVHNRLSLRAEAGKITMLIGKNASGKSTVGLEMIKLFAPDSGEVRINEENVRTIETVKLRSHVGMLLQDSPVLTMSVLENLWFGRDSDALSDEARRAVTERFLAESKFPMGSLTLDRPLASALKRQSGGEAIKLAMLRAVMFEYSLLFIDEPTNNLDAESVQWFVQWLRRIKTERGRAGAYTPTIVLVTHQPGRFFDIVDDVWAMNNGQARHLTDAEIARMRAPPPPPQRAPMQETPAATVQALQAVVQALDHFGAAAATRPTPPALPPQRPAQPQPLQPPVVAIATAPLPLLRAPDSAPVVPPRLPPPPGEEPPTTTNNNDELP